MKDSIIGACVLGVGVLFVFQVVTACASGYSARKELERKQAAEQAQLEQEAREAQIRLDQSERILMLQR